MTSEQTYNRLFEAALQSESTLNQLHPGRVSIPSSITMTNFEEGKTGTVISQSDMDSSDLAVSLSSKNHKAPLESRAY